ncbi:Phytanoyl-CoA dioxygenase peroxisomal, partial [Operophtera brumata]
DFSLVGKSSNPEDYVNKEITLLNRTKPSHFHQIQDILHDEVFMTYSEDPRLLHIVSQLLGEDLTAINSMLINKPPGTTRHAPHQDLYYLPVRPANIVGTWSAIDSATIENGCLKKFFHVLMNEEKYAPVEKRVYIEMNPGDTVFLHPLLIHGSGPNVSK